jgi:hypothetical protein
MYIDFAEFVKKILAQRGYKEFDEIKMYLTDVITRICGFGADSSIK